jgi:hypothetical protein
MSMSDGRPWADPNAPGNKIRPRVRCVGCGAKGCVTHWGPWCFDCNVMRMDHLNGRFAEIRRNLDAIEAAEATS